MTMKQKVKGQKSVKEVEQNYSIVSIVITVRMTIVSVAFPIFLTLLGGLRPDS